MCSHITNKGEQMVRYYGYYSKVSRGRQKKGNRDALIPSVLEPNEDSKAYRKNWARLIQKIYKADPLLCPKCQGQMRIISSIEDPEVIKKILKHLGLWSAKRKPSPRANAPPVYIHLDYSDRTFGDVGRGKVQVFGIIDIFWLTYVEPNRSLSYVPTRPGSGLARGLGLRAGAGVFSAPCAR
jgi:hypothetical protein